MELEQFLNPASLASEAVAITIIAAALALILWVNRRRLLASLREWRIQRRLDQIGSEQLRDFVCPDGLDGYYQLAILLISYKPYGGNIYCAEHISEWTQVVGQKSFKFENPLFELENQLTALRELSGNATLRGHLFFNQSAMFPKGHPEAVLTPDSIPQSYLAESGGAASGEIRAAWELLKAHQKEARASGQVGVKT